MARLGLGRGINEFVNETWLVKELLPLHRLGWRGWSSPARARSCQSWEMALEMPLETLPVLLNAAPCKIKILGLGDFWNLLINGVFTAVSVPTR